MRFIYVITSIALAAGCAPQSWERDTELGTASLAAWSLQADDHQVLREPGRAEVGYPNPLECDQLEVEISARGAMCGRCVIDDGVIERCGGPEVGLPFMMTPLRREGRLDIVVADVYGTMVRTLSSVIDVCVTAYREEGEVCTVCTDEEGAISFDSCAADDEEEEQCLALTQSEGSSCTICADSAGNTTYNDCAEYGGASGAGPSEDDGQVEGGFTTGDGEGEIGGAADCYPAPGSETCAICFAGEDQWEECEQSAGGQGGSAEAGEPTLEEQCFQAGIRAYIDELDGTLEDWGLASSGLQPSHVDAEPGFSLGVLATTYCSTMFSRTQTSDGQYLRDDDLRCAALGTDTVVETCDLIPEPCEERGSMFRQGVVAAYQVWSEGSAVGGWGTLFDDGGWADGGSEVDEFTPNPDLPECTGSPLVLDLGGGIELLSKEEGVAFDLLGTGRAVQTGWVSRGGLLAMDLDGDGAISSGRELFGEATALASGVRAGDGFAALAQYDLPAQGGNLDGKVDAADPVYHRLLLWTDRDLDGESRLEELTPLSAAGVRAIHLSSTKALYPDAASAGNDVGLAGSFEWADGRQGALYDVWFRYGRAPLHCM